MRLRPTTLIIIFFGIGFLLLIVYSITMLNAIKHARKRPVNASLINYVALGDSYTIGEGVSESERFPNMLVDTLNKNGFSVKLVANPAQTGWTTKDVYDWQLPILESSNAHFTTLLIGANDIVQGKSEEEFRNEYVKVLEEIIRIMNSNEKILIVTIPDFSKSPRGKYLKDSSKIESVIQTFNRVIKEEAKRKEITVADIYTISKNLSSDPEAFASDGLHPSRKQYKKWEEIIYPASYNLLAK